jgi:hypothetical protein
LIGGVVATAIDERLREAERHRRVIGPLAGFQRKGPTADHVGERLKRPGRAKLDRRPDGIPRCQAEQGATGTITSSDG